MEATKKYYYPKATMYIVDYMAFAVTLALHLMNPLTFVVHTLFLVCFIFIITPYLRK